MKVMPLLFPKGVFVSNYPPPQNVGFCWFTGRSSDEFMQLLAHSFLL